jgi:hypothetical protein
MDNMIMFSLPEVVVVDLMMGAVVVPVDISRTLM